MHSLFVNLRKITLLSLAAALLCLASCIKSDPLKPVKPLPNDVFPLVGQQALGHEIDRIITPPIFKHSSIGLKVVRLSDGMVLYEKNADLLFHPASTMKLFTTAAALTHLGPDQRFRTILAAPPAAMTSKAINGDLFLIGGGDPALGTADLGQMAARLRRAGVTKVSGNIICDDTFFDDLRYGSGWMWDDQPYKDFAPISALSTNRNTIEIIVSPGQKPGEPALVRTLPDTDFISIDNRGITVIETGGAKTAMPLTVLRRWQARNNIIDVKGTITVNQKNASFVRNIVGPARYTGSLFKQECEKAGISIAGRVVAGKAPAGYRPLITHESKPLSQIIVEMNRESHNLDAELLLKGLAAHVEGAPGTAENGIAVINDTLASWGIERGSIKFADGSGVSRYGLVSPHALTALLSALHHNSTVRSLFTSSLATAGVDGTLKDRMQGSAAHGQVHAKTGFMSGVAALAGYAESAKGRKLAFAIMMAHFIDSPGEYLAAQDKICELLCRYAETDPFEKGAKFNTRHYAGLKKLQN